MSPIVDKLKKLIAHERSARTIGNTSEAESFATKIQELLVRHKLSMSEVECEEQDQTNPIGTASSVINKTKAEYWVRMLSAAVAHSFYCDCLFKDGFRKQKASAVFIGRESDREAAATLFNYLYALGVELGRAKTRELKTDGGVLRAVEKLRLEGRSDTEQALNRLGRMYKKEFLLGYASALYRRLEANKKDFEGAAGSNAAALIVRDAQAIRDYCRARFDVVEQRPRTPKVHTGAFCEGFQAGHDVSIAARAGITAGDGR